MSVTFQREQLEISGRYVEHFLSLMTLISLFCLKGNRKNEGL